MKILIAVELNVPDSPLLVSEIDIPTPHTESEKIGAAVTFLHAEERVLKQSVKLRKYTVKGRHKKLKSIRCPHCKFNYTKHGKRVVELEAALKEYPDRYHIVWCTDCKELYSVRKWGISGYEMEW